MENRSILILLLAFYFSGLSFGQDISLQTQPQDTAVSYSSDFDPDEIMNYIQNKKMSLSVEVGTSFGTAPGYGSYFSTYLAPHLSYQLSPKFTLSGGLKLINYQGGFDYFGSDYLYRPTGNYVYRPVSLVYMEGAYRINDNLTFTGAAYHQIDTFKNPAGFNNNLKGIIMGVDYKIGENAWIRGQVEFSNGYRGFGNYPGVNPWQRNYFSPAGSLNDPF
jgi:hypothetical protein